MRMSDISTAARESKPQNLSQFYSGNGQAVQVLFTNCGAALANEGAVPFGEPLRIDREVVR